MSSTGFIHSIPVPRIYKTASKVAKDVKEGKDSLKNLVYEQKRTNIKVLYALVVEALKRDEIIEDLIEKSELLVKEPRFNVWLAKILICELLWGKNKMTRGSKPIETILSYEEALRQLLKDCDDSIQSIPQHKILKPRYVRVNTLKISVEEAVNNFKEEGWIFVPFFNKTDYEGFQNRLTNLKPDEFIKDIHIPDLLIFPPRTEFYQHQAYKTGNIILQDKASCLPVHLLAPPPGSSVLDTCAAPGMKTTQLAALLRNEGKVFAVELNPRRENLLRTLVESVGATCIKTILKDVMQVTNADCPDVEYILVDPSCSGSGITDRVEIEKLDNKTRIERLRKLCNFQSKLLRYTMTAFPKAKRIVYSTCSMNSEENEDVVRQVLETSRHFKLTDARKLLPSWNTKSSEIYPDLGNMCIFATPEQDKTNGFFVAVFEKLQDGEKNPYLNFELCKFFDKEAKKNQKYSDDEYKDIEMKRQNWCKENNLLHPKCENFEKSEEKDKLVTSSDDLIEPKNETETLESSNICKTGKFLVRSLVENIREEKKHKGKHKGNQVDNADSVHYPTIETECSVIKQKNKYKNADSSNDITCSDKIYTIDLDSESHKAKKKNKKLKNMHDESTIYYQNSTDISIESTFKERKKRKKSYTEDNVETKQFTEDSNHNSPEKKKSKKKTAEIIDTLLEEKKHKSHNEKKETTEIPDESIINADSEKKLKKKKNKCSNENILFEPALDIPNDQKENNTEESTQKEEYTLTKKKKKSNKSHKEDRSETEPITEYCDHTSLGKKKSKRKIEENSIEIDDTLVEEKTKHKKSRKEKKETTVVSDECTNQYKDSEKKLKKKKNACSNGNLLSEKTVDHKNNDIETSHKEDTLIETDHTSIKEKKKCKKSHKSEETLESNEQKQSKKRKRIAGNNNDLEDFKQYPEAEEEKNQPSIKSKTKKLKK